MGTGDLAPADRAFQLWRGLRRTPPAPEGHGLAAQGQASPGAWLLRPPSSGCRHRLRCARGQEAGFRVTEENLRATRV